MEDFFELFGAYERQVAALTTIATVFISVVSLFVAVLAIFWQRRYERASLRPLAHIVTGDFKREIFVGLRNVGVGPMIARSVKFISAEPSERNRLIELMPSLSSQVSWASFSTDLTGHSLGVGEQIDFVRLTGDDQQGAFETERDTVRDTLKTININIVYEDLYGQVFQSSKMLDRFGRSISDQNT